MKFKIDENLPIDVADLLRKSGYDATTVLEQDIGGCADSDLASICQKETRAFITLDTDFADIRAYPPGEFFGLIVLRLRHHDKPYVMQVISRLISMLLTEPLERHLWIVEEDRIRIRD
jgi:predicted nuclease of predicted toxin-antitoxin system